MKDQKKQNKILKIINSSLFVMLMTVCVLVIFFNVTHDYFIVYGQSMIPTLNVGVTSAEESKDAVFVSKIKKVKRGDIIVANKNYGIENAEEKFVIKRVIALGGDKIKIEIINGYERIVLVKMGETEETILEETYLPDYSVNEGLKLRFDSLVNNNMYQLDEFGFLTIDDDKVFYLGDNRKNSTDCLSYGPVAKKIIVGKVDYFIYNNKNIVGQVLSQVFGG